MWIRRTPSTLGTTFVDEQSERAKAGMLLAAIVAFLTSGWYSYNELRYALRSETVDAMVVRMFEYTVPTRHGTSGPRLGVEYEFADTTGQRHTDRDWVPLPSELVGRKTVRVQYLPGGERNSRLEANRSVLGPAIFLACLAAVVLALIRLIREANAPVPKRRRRRRSMT